MGKLRQLVSHPPRVTQSSKHNIKRFNISLYSGDKSYFCAQKRKKAISQSALLRISYHSRGMDTSCAVFHPSRALPLSLPALNLRSTPPDGSGFASSAVTVSPATFAGIRGFIVSCAQLRFGRAQLRLTASDSLCQL